MGRPASDALGVLEKQSSLPAARISGEMALQEISSREMADYLGLSLQAVNQYRQGLANPTYPNLLKIAKRLNTTTDYLLGAEDCKNHLNEEAHKHLGLSDAAINTLKRYDDIFRDFGQIDAVNALLETRWGDRLLQIISAYVFADFSSGYRTDADVYEGYEGMENIPISKIEFRNGTSGYAIHRVFAIQDMAEALLLEVSGLIRRIRKAKNPAGDAPLDRPRGVSTHVHFGPVPEDESGEDEANVNPED